MAKRKSTKRGKVINSVTMIDPANTGSFIGTYIKHPELRRMSNEGKWYVSGDASLRFSDCSRQIQWDFTNYGDSLFGDESLQFSGEKLNTIIMALDQFSYELAEAKSALLLLETECEARNKLLDDDKKE